MHCRMPCRTQPWWSSRVVVAILLMIVATLVQAENVFRTPIADTEATTNDMSLNPVYVKGRKQMLRWTFDHEADWDLYLYRWVPKKPDVRSEEPIMSFERGYSDSDDSSWTWTVDPADLKFDSPMSTYWLKFYTNSTSSDGEDGSKEFWSHYFNITDDPSKATDDADSKQSKDNTVVQSWNNLSPAAKAAIGVAGGLAVLLVIAIIASLIIWRKMTRVRYMSECRSSRLPSFDSTRELRASSKDIAAEYHAIAEKQGQGRYYAQEVPNFSRAFRPDGDGRYWKESPVFH